MPATLATVAHPVLSSGRGPRPEARGPTRSPRALALALPFAAAVALAACSDGMQVASVHVKSGSIGPTGGALVITSADHQELAGTRIVFPPGALERTTFIAIGFSDASLTLDDARAAGPALYFEPIGLALAQPAAITVPYDKSIDARRLLVRTQSNGEVTDVTARVTTVDDAAALVTFDIDRLGHVQPQAIPLVPPDAGCNAPQCPPPPDAATVDAGCLLGTCPGIDAGTPIDAANPPTCPLFCTVGTMCNPATGTCQAICNNMICPQGQGCNQNNVCVAQCGMGGQISFLCPPNQVCDFATGTCHP